LKTSQEERRQHQAQAQTTKNRLLEARIPVMVSETHIVPVYVGDPELCKRASDMLLEEHGVYIQPINFPTVPKGTERLRITPTPLHTDELIDELVEAMSDVWSRLNLPRDFTPGF
jgi:5-aminolevulinate synthase